MYPQEPGGRTCAPNRVLKAGKFPNDAKIHLEHLAWVNLCQSSILFSSIQNDTNISGREWLGSSRALWPNAQCVKPLDYSVGCPMDVQWMSKTRPKHSGSISSPASISLDIWQEVVHFFTFYALGKQHFLSPLQKKKRSLKCGSMVDPNRLWSKLSTARNKPSLDSLVWTCIALCYACISAIALCHTVPTPLLFNKSIYWGSNSLIGVMEGELLLPAGQSSKCPCRVLILMDSWCKTKLDHEDPSNLES